VHGWVALLGSVAAIAIILTALGIMLGMVKFADALKYLGAILVVAIVLMLLPGLTMCAWLGMSLMQQIALIVIGIALWQLSRRQQRSRNNKSR
jgi:predicted tellurium resistance membrane protein TerC